jgi:hypothetical protein
MKELGAWESTVLRKSVFATTTSEALSEALAAEFACAPPAVVYNAFPFAERATIDGEIRDRHDQSRASLVWFSQVIGPGRGLETLMDSLSEVHLPLEIHLRGTCAPDFAATLVKRAPPEWRQHIFIHGQVRHADLISRIAEHDVGYAGDIPHCASRDLTITNKILQYLLAGLPVVASDTAGHREVARHSDRAVSLFQAGDPGALARSINALLGARDRLPAAKADAVIAAERVFCWEKVAPRLLRQVAKHVPP